MAPMLETDLNRVVQFVVLDSRDVQVYQQDGEAYVVRVDVAHRSCGCLGCVQGWCRHTAFIQRLIDSTGA